MTTIKYLSDYTKEAQATIFKELDVMFAFSDKQLEEAMAERGITDRSTLTSLGAGLIIPKQNVKEFKERMDKAIKTAVAQDLAENGRAGVLERELGNYEIGYSFNRWHDENFRAAIDGYGFTEDEIKNAYYLHMENTEY